MPLRSLFLDYLSVFEANRISQLFDYVNTQITKEKSKFVLSFSLFELYRGSFIDLLSQTPGLDSLRVRQNSNKTRLYGLSKTYFTSPLEFFEYLSFGFGNRCNHRMRFNTNTGNTNTILTLKCTEEFRDGSEKKSTISFIDLDCPFRGNGTWNFMDRPRNIGESVRLGSVINAVSLREDGHARHVPYRDSKLTHLFQDSLGGKTKALFILTLRQLTRWKEEFIETLRFGKRLSNVKNRPENIKKVKSCFHFLNGSRDQVEIKSGIECDAANPSTREKRAY